VTVCVPHVLRGLDGLRTGQITRKTVGAMTECPFIGACAKLSPGCAG
jgi:hypothetical protein